MVARLTWLERMALSVEQRFPIGHGPWSVVYLIAAAALLPSVLILSAGTGMVVLAYMREGLYASDGCPAGFTLGINIFCTLLGWFFCSWWVMVLRLWHSHRRKQPYSSRCVLWVSGLVVTAELALAIISLITLSTGAGWAALPACLMLLIGYLFKRNLPQ